VKLGVKLSPGREEGLGEIVFKTFFVCFSLAYSDSYGDKLNEFPQDEYVLPVMVSAE